MWFNKKKPKEPINKEIFQKIQSILVKQLSVSVDKIRLESRINDDIGADLLDAVEIVMELEEEFGIEISDEDAEKIVTLEDIVKYVQAKIAQANRPESKPSERDNREPAI